MVPTDARIDRVAVPATLDPRGRRPRDPVDDRVGPARRDHVGLFVERLGAVGEDLEDAGRAIVRSGDSVDGLSDVPLVGEGFAALADEIEDSAATRQAGSFDRGTTSTGWRCSWAPSWRSAPDPRARALGAAACVQGARTASVDALAPNRRRARDGLPREPRRWRRAASAAPTGERRPGRRSRVRPVRGPGEAQGRITSPCDRRRGSRDPFGTSSPKATPTRR